MLIWTLVAATAHAGCDPERLEPEVDAAEQAYTSADAAAAAAAAQAAVAALECQSAALEPDDAARLHRARALAMYLDGDSEGATLALRAMLHADPFLTLPAELAGPDDAIHRLRIRAEESQPEWTSLRLKADESAVVDGVQSLVVPLEQPYVLQKLGTDGTIRSSRLVERGTTASRGPAPTRTEVSGATKRLRWAGVASGVVAGGLYGGAWGANSAYQRAVIAQDDPAIGSLHTATNALSIGSVAAATTALTTLVMAEVVK